MRAWDAKTQGYPPIAVLSTVTLIKRVLFKMIWSPVELLRMISTSPSAKETD